ncbi:hypothetical protein EDB80DRAFT_685951 [Ilyonectria destructans]|nr:hypothetical protein EDB80DRAFT_685951 [Ilyonectria destructans]
MRDSDPYPLWKVVDQHFDVTATEPEFTPMFGRLYLIASAIGAYDEAFATRVATTLPMKTLHPVQEKSFWIIWHWWAENASFFRDRPGKGPVELVNGTRHVLDTIYPPSILIRQLMNFELLGNDDSLRPGSLTQPREQAAIARACHELALPSYFETLASGEFTGLGPLPPGMPAIPPPHSHLGRWEKVEAGQRRKTVIPGVDGWEVPENTIFDVRFLPDLLAKVPTSTRFIWFDLVCIPQDRSPRAQDEIARQAEIFRNASHSIIWLSKLQSWEGVRSAVAWMSLVFLNVYPDPRYRTREYACGPSVRRTFTGLFEPYDFSPSIRRQEMTVCGWFDSLWTLQEVCLRPDMWLCNQDWELLTVGVQRVPVAINALVALTNACAHFHNSRMAFFKIDNFPGHSSKPSFDPTMNETLADGMFGGLISYGVFHPGFLELFELFERSGLEQLLIIQPKNILDLGSKRFCKSRRAEAIICTEVVLHDSPSSSQRGSLMPFAPKASLLDSNSSVHGVTMRQVLGGWTGEAQHPSVAGWTIRQDGSVQMSSVGLIASSSDHLAGGSEDIVGVIWLRYNFESESNTGFPLPEKMRTHSVELRSWLASHLVEDGPNYAIELFSLFSSPYRMKRGILLKEFKNSPGLLIKIGNWAVNFNRGIPETVHKVLYYTLYPLYVLDVILSIYLYF